MACPQGRAQQARRRRSSCDGRGWGQQIGQIAAIGGGDRAPGHQQTSAVEPLAGAGTPGPDGEVGLAHRPTGAADAHRLGQEAGGRSAGEWCIEQQLATGH